MTEIAKVCKKKSQKKNENTNMRNKIAVMN